MASSLKVAAACSLASAVFLAQGVPAQSIAWRFANYGSGNSVVEQPPRSLAFTTDAHVLVLAYTNDVDGAGARLIRYRTPGGERTWQRDFDTLPPSAAIGFPTAAFAVDGDDGIVTSANFDSSAFARVTRVRGSDGATLWQTEDHSSGTDLFYHAVHADKDSNVIAAGSIGNATVSVIGHVVKLDGADGATLWSVNIDPAMCGMQSGIPFRVIDIATDTNADVFVAATGFLSWPIAFCALKLDGTSGAVLWSYGEPRIDNFFAMPQLTVDENGDVTMGGLAGLTYALTKLDGANGHVRWSKPSLPRSTRFTVGMDGTVIAAADGTARAYAAADGQTLWPQDAPYAGTPIVSGDVLVLANSDRVNLRFRFDGVDVHGGAHLWTSTLDVGTDYEWHEPAIAADSGQFVVSDVDTRCCARKQLLTILGSAQTGQIRWDASDGLPGASQALLEEPNPSLNRMAALTNDGAVIGAGTAYPGLTLGIYSSGDAHVLVTKRSVRDGHLLWAQTLDAFTGCRPTRLVLDANDDVLVSAGCDGVPLALKLRGSDGSVLWTGASHANCDYASADSVTVDASNGVYATGYCEVSDTFGQLTVKYDATTGAEKWTQFTAATYSQPLAASESDGVVIAALLNRSGDPDAIANSLAIRRLNGADGSLMWSHYIDPPAGGSYELRNLSTYPSGDVAIAGAAAGGGLIARLKASDGSQKWLAADADVVPIALSIDGNGNMVVAGSALAKYAAASGIRQWLFPQAFNDVAFDHSGTILATGMCTKLCVSAINPSTGLESWRLVDTVAGTYDVGIGILAAADGGILVSAQYAIPEASPWTLVRVIAPTSDGLFANGYEP